MKERKKFPEEIELQMVETAKENSLKDTAKKFDIGVDKLRNILKKYDFVRTEEDRRKMISKKSSRKISEEEAQEIINYYQDHSIAETADKFHYSADWIEHFLKDRELTRQGKEKNIFSGRKRKQNLREQYPINDEEVLNYYKEHSTKITCKKFHINLNMLYEICKRNNIVPRSKEESNTLRVNTNLAKYGAESPVQNPDIWKKKEETTLEKYGVSNVAFLPEVIKKRKQTNLERYGSEIPSTTPKIKAKMEATFLERFGVTRPMQLPKFRQKQAKSAIKSSLEKKVEEFLINNQFNYEHPYTTKKNKLIHAFDFAIFKDNKLEILIDCDGKYYHGYECDIDGKTVNCDVDEYRQLLVPENVKFLIILEKYEEEGYKELLNLYNISYDNYIEEIFNWCREVEFPYPEYNNKILQTSFKSILKADINKFNMRARYGDKIINYFHPSLFKAKVDKHLSPYEAWQDDNLLKKCIKNRIIYKGCNLDRSKVLAGFSISKIAPKISIFNPYLAKYIVEKYLNNYDVIFDPCSGYSGRMLGTCSLNKKYIGQDINPITVEESNNIIAYFNLNAKVKVKNLLEDSGNYPCLFTCTPYKNKENWGQEIENKSCDDWITECLNRYKCEKYVFVVDETEKYKEFIIEEITNKSHFGQNKEYLLLIEGKNEK